MRIAEYKKTGTKTEEYKVTVPAEYDEENNLISEEHEEIRTREVPVMGMEEWPQAGFRIIGISNLQQGFRV